jgi:hypothetical protein
MGPHPENVDGFPFFVHFVKKPMMDIDPSGILSL